MVFAEHSPIMPYYVIEVRKTVTQSANLSSVGLQSSHYAGGPRSAEETG
jgi:hypothetical protein